MKTNNHGFITLLPAILIGLAALFGGTVASAQIALPDSPLYAIKTATEKVRVAIAFDDEKKAKTHLSVAKEKLNELEWMSLKEVSSEDLEKAEKSFEENQKKAKDHIDKKNNDSEVAELNKKLEENGARNIEVLQIVYAKVPEQAQGAIKTVIDNAIERAEERLGTTTRKIRNDNASSTPKNSATTSRGNKAFRLTPAQEKIIESLGIDLSLLPTQLTPEMEACFVTKLGSERVEEIKSGTMPSTSDLVKARSCI